MRWLAALVVSVAAAQSEPVLSVDITTLPGEDYGAAIALIGQAGATATSLSLMWDEAEQDAGVYAADPDWPAIANAYYPGTGYGLSLTFSVIDTVADRRPADLRGLKWDDPLLAARFAAYARAVLERMAATDLLVISVGNEIDGMLAERDEIAAFARFLAAARAGIHALRPGVPVGTKLTFSGLVAAPDRWQPVIDASDALQVTYYPLTPAFEVRPVADIAGDLDRLVDLAGGKPVHVLEAGYPSGGCGVPVGGQLDFVQTLLSEWERHGDRIPLISLTWLTDLTATEVEDYSGYYGVDAACFASYLATLGLRDSDGVAKPALEWLLAR